MITRHDRTIPELLSDVLAQLAKLIGNEFDLAKAELSSKAGQVGRAVAQRHVQGDAPPACAAGAGPRCCSNSRADRSTFLSCAGSWAITATSPWSSASPAVRRGSCE